MSLDYLTLWLNGGNVEWLGYLCGHWGICSVVVIMFSWLAYVISRVSRCLFVVCAKKYG